MSKNIVEQNYNVSVADRRKLNKHNSLLLWFTGLSGSGKSTLANKLEVSLHDEGFRTYVLDGDNIRGGLNSDLDFTPEGRQENLRRIAETAKLFVDAGVLTLAAFISPLEKDRQHIKEIVGEENFVEIYVKASIETCEERDVKGLYKKARKGEIDNFTGISAPYEEPKNPDIEIDSGAENVDDSLEKLLKHIKPLLEVSSESQ